jgi:hypothetical protein
MAAWQTQFAETIADAQCAGTPFATAVADRCAPEYANCVGASGVASTALILDHPDMYQAAVDVGGHTYSGDELIIAAAANSVGCLRRLLAAAGPPENTLALNAAVSTGAYDAVSVLLAAGSPHNGAQVITAITRGDLAMLRLLLDRDCFYNPCVAAVKAIDAGRLDMLRALLAHHVPLLPAATQYAVAATNAAALEVLLRHGAPADETCMTTAVALEARQIIKLLLEYDAPYDRCAVWVTASARGYTAILGMFE